MQKKLLTALAAAGVCALLAGVALQERGGRSPAALLATQKLYGYYPYPYGSAGGGGYPYGGGYGGGYPGEKHRPVLLHHAAAPPYAGKGRGSGCLSPLLFLRKKSVFGVSFLCKRILPCVSSRAN
jgi:hypothetical protein